MESSSSSGSTSPIIDPVSDDVKQQGRILHDVLCEVCQDFSSGKHYGIYACDGCAGFFKRSIRSDSRYECKSSSPGQCVIERMNRNRCRACRLQKCFTAGMIKDAVQNERGPRNSTVVRQLNLCSEVLGTETHLSGAGYIGMPYAPAAISPLAGMPMPMIAPPASLYANPSFAPPPSNFLTAIQSAQSNQDVQNIASGHVIRSVREMKNTGRFSELNISDQLLLVEGCWKECFLLSVAQYMTPLPFENILLTQISEKGYDHYTPQLIKDVEVIGQIVQMTVAMQLDSKEYELLQAVMLFQRAFNERMHATYTQLIQRHEILIQEGYKIELLYEEATANLFNYVVPRGGEVRYQDILQLIPHLRAASFYALEELFFRKIIGNTPMVRVLSELYISGQI